MNKKDKLIYTLSIKNIIFLLFYYLLLIIIGTINTIYTMNSINYGNQNCNYLLCAFLGSVSIGVMLCSVYYIKCLYKACIDNRIEEKNDIIKIGNMGYFLFRPLFVVVFSIVFICFILSGMFVVTANLDYILNEKFVYLCMVSCSFLGFSIGKFFDKFENISSAKIEEFKI